MAFSTSTTARWTILSSKVAVPLGPVLPPVRLRDICPPARRRPVASLLHPLVQVPEISHQVLPVGLPRHPVHPRRRLRADVLIGQQKAFEGDMVQQRREPRFPVPYCHLPHTAQLT